MDFADLPTYLFLNQAAARYGVDLTVLHRAITEGTVRAVRTAKGVLLVAGEDVETISKSQQSRGATPEPKRSPPEPPIDWLTTREAASLTGYSAITFRQAARRGTIPHTKKGNILLFRREDVVSYYQRMMELGSSKHTPKEYLKPH
jgi:excisionase family DNA binding protein